jgi:hypothetical protein
LEPWLDFESGISKACQISYRVRQLSKVINIRIIVPLWKWISAILYEIPLHSFLYHLIFFIVMYLFCIMCTVCV